LGRGGTCKVIVVPLLATVFNHAGCSDESPFFCTKKRPTQMSRSFLVQQYGML